MTLQNNGDNDDLGAQLTRELHRRTAGMHETPLGFDDVRGKATSIRRRRQLATGVGIAAAVAVIVPTAMFATKDVNSDGQQPATRPPTVSDTANPTPTSTPTMGSDPHALDVRDLPTGAPPAVGYKQGEGAGLMTYVDMDGVEIRSGGSEIRITGPDGSRETYPSESGLAVNDLHTAVAWVTLDGVVMAWLAGTSEAVELGSTDLTGAQVEAVTGRDCQSAEGSCMVWLRGSSGPSYEPASVTVAPGSVIEPVDGLVQVRDASDVGLAVGGTRLLSDGSCSAVVDLATGRERFETCDYQVDAISPSGGYVLASEPWHSGNLNGTVAVLDAQTGEVLASRIAKLGNSAFYGQAVWEDDEHVLFSAFQEGNWSIVRMNVQGAMEYAVPPFEGGDEMAHPIGFETR